MVQMWKSGAWLVNGRDLYADSFEGIQDYKARYGTEPARDAAAGTMAYRILQAHNTSGDPEHLKVRFDKLTSHDITFVGIIQTARASGLERFPMPYVLTNCHNSLCAVGGTINEDDHVFGLSCAKKYGGIYVPPHQAVIHQFAREMLAECGAMILGSDSHTRYGALGTMAVGEGGPELVKQLLSRTYDIDRPEVIAVYLTGEPAPGVGPQDVALALVGGVFASGYVKNKVLEFVGPGVEKLSADFRIGVDVMTTETTCLSSIWRTDETIREFYAVHGRPEAYKQLDPEPLAYYDGVVEINLSEVKSMIALPFHPSNVYTIEDVNRNAADIFAEVEEKAKKVLSGNVNFTLRDKIRGGRVQVQQGVIAGCAGGGFENLCAAADILKDADIGSDAFSLSVYPASQPIFLELVRNGSVETFLKSGATVRTAFCGPCFGAGDVPANGGLSIRHSTRNFPNREGSRIQNGQIASVALMDARSIAATAAHHGMLTAATEVPADYRKPKYFFDKSIYDKRVYNGFGNAQPDEPIVFGPNIKDWPQMIALPDNLFVRIASEIHDAVTTTDELIPSGETSSYRSNPLALAEFTLSRRDPDYLPRAKAVQALEQARRLGSAPDAQEETLAAAFAAAKSACPDITWGNTGLGSCVYAKKPGDGSAREQAASCQRVLGGVANIAEEYATKRYRSNLINWGMLPLLFAGDDLPFACGDWVFFPGIRKAVQEEAPQITGYAVKDGQLTEVTFTLGNLGKEERQIILDGCLMNHYKAGLAK